MPFGKTRVVVRSIHLQPRGGSRPDRAGQPITRDEFAHVLVKHATAAGQANPALLRKHITPMCCLVVHSRY